LDLCAVHPRESEADHPWSPFCYRLDRGMPPFRDCLAVRALASQNGHH
jgi:hypothetical protein